MNSQKTIVPPDYDEFANNTFDEEAFNRIFGEETKEEIEESLKDDMPI
jgi:hypothetical protein